MLPIAVALGAGKGLAGAFTAQSQGHHNARSIRRAYRAGDAQLQLEQGDIRQSTNESLAARGLLNAGGGGGTTPQVAAPVKPNIRGMGFGKALAAGTAYNTADRTSTMRNIASRNEVGLAGTIGAGVSSDLSKEFYKERENLWNEHANALDDNSAATRNAYIGAIGDGISTAAAADNAFGSSAPAAVAGATTTKVAPPNGTPSGIPAAYGVDVVDPLTALEGPVFTQTLRTQKGPR